MLPHKRGTNVIILPLIEKQRNELLIYSKNKERRIFQATEKKTISPIPLQLTSSGDEGPSPSTSIPILVSSTNNELDIPIALRKGTRKCTKHPFSNFVSYSCLSPSHKAFVSVKFEV